MDASLYELKNSFVESDGDGLYWVVRNKETESEYGDRVICEAFPKGQGETHEDMLSQGYIHYGNQGGESFYIQEHSPKFA